MTEASTPAGRRLIAATCTQCSGGYFTRPSRSGGYCSRACAGAAGNASRWAGQHDTVAARFWPRVAKGGPDDCWPWMGRLSADGYGLFKALGRTLLSHRAAFALANGAEPSEWVLHRCDNRACCNPSHHFKGGVVENNADRDQKERFHSVLTPQDVRAIRTSALSNAALARAHSVDPSNISHIRAGRRWRRPDVL